MGFYRYSPRTFNRPADICHGTTERAATVKFRGLSSPVNGMKNGGALTIESESGKETTVTVSLPAERVVSG